MGGGGEKNASLPSTLPAHILVLNWEHLLISLFSVGKSTGHFEPDYKLCLACVGMQLMNGGDKLHNFNFTNAPIANAATGRANGL